MKKIRFAAFLAAVMGLGLFFTSCDPEADDLELEFDFDDSGITDSFTGNNSNGNTSGNASGNTNGGNNSSGNNAGGANGPAFLSNYSLVWSDEFDYTGLPDSNNWGYDVGRGVEANSDGTNPKNWGWGNGELQYYTNGDLDNTYVSDGTLKLKAIKENISDTTYSSARIVTRNKQIFKYGYIEMKAKITENAGTWPAFWMLDNDIYNGQNWPLSGEIDIMESSTSVWGTNESNAKPGVYGHKGNVWGTLHTQSGNSGNPVISDGCFLGDLDADWHTYAVNWTETKIEWWFDGIKRFTYTPNSYSKDDYPFNEEFYIIINLAVGGNLGGWIDPNWNESTMEIDYVRVYQKNNDENNTDNTPGQVSPYKSVILHPELDVNNPLKGFETWGSSEVQITDEVFGGALCKKVEFKKDSGWNNVCGGFGINGVSVTSQNKLTMEVYSSKDFAIKPLYSGAGIEVPQTSNNGWKTISIQLNEGTLTNIGFVSSGLQTMYIKSIVIE